jgi:hypothetical protein
MNQFMHVTPDMTFDGPVLFLIVALVCALALAVRS